MLRRIKKLIEKLIGYKSKKQPDDVITGRKAKKVIAKMDKSLWLSDHGVIHNSLCKWHRNCDGKEWNGEGDYDQCGLCGGANPIVHRWNIK